MKERERERKREKERERRRRRKKIEDISFRDKRPFLPLHSSWP
jgi:hypothetical protein